MPISDLLDVDESGYKYPDFPTLLERIKDEYRAIYGADVYLEEDSQDGQWVSIQTKAMFSVIQATAAAYNSFSPKTAQGQALSNNVAINGISRSAPTFSQVDLVIVGQASTVINNGQVEDSINQKWNLPTVVAIPLSGEVTVTAIADKEGSVNSQANTITKIVTPTNGWQTVNNPTSSSIGNPTETDAQLRVRQSTSTMIPNLTVLDGIIGAIESLNGVTSVSGFVNDTDFANLDGIPAHSISLVVFGGDSQEIADTIAKKKSPGTGTYGTTSILTFDARGVENTINFYRPTFVEIDVQITLKALSGYLNTTSEDIKEAVSNYINSLGNGGEVYNTKLCVPANLSNAPEGDTFDLLLVEARRGTEPFSESNIPILFYESPQCLITNVEVFTT